MPVIRIYGHSTIILKKGPPCYGIALQSKGRLNEESMALLHRSRYQTWMGKAPALLVPAKIFRLKSFSARRRHTLKRWWWWADIGIVGENEFAEKDKRWISLKAGFSKCRLSLAIQNRLNTLTWAGSTVIATSYPGDSRKISEGK